MFFGKFFTTQLVLFLLVSLAKGFQQQQQPKQGDGVTLPKSSQLEQTTVNSNPPSSLNEDESLSPIHATSQDEDNGLVEVKEDEIPEGTPVYVLEEPVEKPTDMEIMQTAHNIVFRPLFRYRGKQEALRRNGQRFRRRYFVPKRSYRQTYRYPYYYPSRYYYY